jgi:hypothetical protein
LTQISLNELSQTNVNVPKPGTPSKQASKPVRSKSPKPAQTAPRKMDAET